MSSTPSSQTSVGIFGGPFMVGQGHKNGLAFAPNTSLWSGPTPPTSYGTSYQSGLGSPFAGPSVFKSDNHKRDSFASNHLETSTWTSTGTSSRPSYRPTTIVGPVSTSGGYRATSNVEKLVSISAMPAYNTKSHEELRLEDYMTGKRGLGTNSSEVKLHKIPFPKITSPSVTMPCARDPIYPDNNSNPFTPRTRLTSPASPVSPASFKHWCNNPFANPSTSPPKQPSSPSFSIPTFSIFPKDSKIAPVSSEPVSFISKPITLVNPCVPSNQQTRIIGQSSASQLSASHATSTSSLANPFGTLPPSRQSSFGRSRSIPVQYGISSIPVKDKPAPVTYPLHATRHISRGCKLPVRKHEPKSSVPFFLSEL